MREAVTSAARALICGKIQADGDTSPQIRCMPFKMDDWPGHAPSERISGTSQPISIARYRIDSPLPRFLHRGPPAAAYRPLSFAIPPGACVKNERRDGKWVRGTFSSVPLNYLAAQFVPVKLVPLHYRRVTRALFFSVESRPPPHAARPRCALRIITNANR